MRIEKSKYRTLTRRELTDYVYSLRDELSYEERRINELENKVIRLVQKSNILEETSTNTPSSN